MKGKQLKSAIEALTSAHAEGRRVKRVRHQPKVTNKGNRFTKGNESRRPAVRGWAAALEGDEPLADDDNVSTDETLEWEDTGADFDNDIVAEIKETIDADADSEMIDEADIVISETQTQIDKLDKLHDTIPAAWEEYGDITEEVFAIEPTVESMWTSKCNSERTAKALQSAVEFTLVELGVVGLVGVSAVAIGKKAARIRKRLTSYANVATKLEQAVKSSKKLRSSLRNEFDANTISGLTLPNITLADTLEKFIDNVGTEDTTLRLVSNAIVESQTTAISNRVFSGSVNNPQIVDSAAEAVGNAQDLFGKHTKDLDVFFKGLDLVVQSKFEGNWDAFSDIPFIKELTEATREATAKMVQLPKSCPSLMSIEKVEETAVVIAKCVDSYLDVNKYLHAKLLEKIEKRIADIPDKLETLEKDVAERGEVMTSSMREYVECIELLAEYTGEFCDAGTLLITTLENHGKTLEEIDKLNK